MKKNLSYLKGLSLVEFMVAITIGLLLVASFLAVYLIQTQSYKTTASQGYIQNAENALSAILSPYMQGAGFAGCATLVNALSNLNAGGPPPLGNINTTGAIVQGYQAITKLIQINAANDTSASSWSPRLDPTLVGKVEAGSDVLVILGPSPGARPVSINSAISSSSTSFNLQSTTGLTVGQYAALSDCAKTSVFVLTSVSGNTLSYAAGAGALNNITSNLGIAYAIGSQFIPLQQSAFFVGQGLGGQSALMMASLNGATWNIQALVPGVDSMKILYGIGANGVLSQYVSAASVSDWTKVYAITIAFLLEGKAASGSYSKVNPTQFTLLNQTVTIPADNKLRHVFILTFNLRNTTS